MQSAKDVGHRIQLDRWSCLRRSALAGLLFGHAYFSNMVAAFHDWHWNIQDYERGERRSIEDFVEEYEGPKKPECQMGMLKEALHSASTLREMLRMRTASAPLLPDMAPHAPPGPSPEKRRPLRDRAVPGDVARAEAASASMKLEERQEPAQHEPLVGLEGNPVP